MILPQLGVGRRETCRGGRYETEIRNLGATTTTTTDTTTTATTTPAPRKLTICHHTQGKKGTKRVTIRINRTAWKAHQCHGDLQGACTTVAAKKFHSRAAHAKKFHKKKR